MSQRAGMNLVLLVLFMGVASSSAIAVESTLTLDSLSFISFQDEVTNPIAGGTLRFNFAAPNPDGSIPFTIAPNDVSLAPVTIPSLHASLQYSLANQASGVMTSTPSGRKIVFNGIVAAKDLDDPDSQERTYTLSFTTEEATAESLDGSTTVEREGVRIPTAARYVQLVGATVNESENLHGAAVYMVLSGTFDQLP